MLRRPATVIQLTQADIEEYEARRQRKLWEQQQAQAQAQAQAHAQTQTQNQSSSQSTNTSDKTKEQVPPTNIAKSKKDRIMGGGSGRGN